MGHAESTSRPDPHDEDGLSLVSTVALAMFATDEAAAREALRQLRDWADACGPRHPAESVRGALDCCLGTVIEPFHLSSRVKEVVVVLMRAAFSRRHLVTRFRVVSEECLGTRAGAVFTNNLEHYYVERFALGKRRTDPAKGWAVAPLSGRHLFLGTPASRIRGSVSLDEKGVSIRVEGIGSGEYKVSVGGQMLSREKFGVTCSPGSTTIRPPQSETTLRLLAFCSNESILSLLPKGAAGGPRAFFKLQPPAEDGETLLPSIVALDPSSYSEWLSVKGADGRCRSDPKLLLREGFPIALPWISAALKEFS